MNEIMIDLQGGAKAPLYEKIYEYIKNEIVDGKISKGEKLPSTRLLAKNLSVSRSTVELAYDQLLPILMSGIPCRLLRFGSLNFPDDLLFQIECTILHLLRSRACRQDPGNTFGRSIVTFEML